jgi:vitamin K-dependent gamma-carboxylase
MNHDQITVFIIHNGGLFIDLFVGWLLFFDKTRLIGTLISSSFHLMNSRMFNIGMFPYAMLATTAIFYSNDWPKRIFTSKASLQTAVDSNGQFYISKLSPHCIYTKNLDESNKKSKTLTTTRPSFYHKFFTFFTILFIAEQSFLPYSHFITKVFLNLKKKFLFFNFV